MAFCDVPSSQAGQCGKLPGSHSQRSCLSHLPVPSTCPPVCPPSCPPLQPLANPGNPGKPWSSKVISTRLQWQRPLLTSPFSACTTMDFFFFYLKVQYNHQKKIPIFNFFLFLLCYTRFYSLFLVRRSLQILRASVCFFQFSTRRILII